MEGSEEVLVAAANDCVVRIVSVYHFVVSALTEELHSSYRSIKSASAFDLRNSSFRILAPVLNSNLSAFSVGKRVIVNLCAFLLIVGKGLCVKDIFVLCLLVPNPEVL